MQTAIAATLYVDGNSTNPVAPYTNWATAATVIQEAVDAASAGDSVLVTNGTYSTGGKVMAGDLTNRVALDKALTLESVNGPEVTAIEGVFGIGSNAVRCVWMTNLAVLSGFTVQNGSTRGEGDTVSLQSGGGVWCSGSDATITNCLVRWNLAQNVGGGVYHATVLNSTVMGNTAALGGGVSDGVATGCTILGNEASSNGGGAYNSTLRNSAVIDNLAGNAGGSYSSSLYNCTVTRNQSSGSVGGSYLFVGSAVARNTIIYGNMGATSSSTYNYDYPVTSSAIQYSCTTPTPSGSGNIGSDPQVLADGYHIAETSPCRGMGDATFASGTDIDGQSWTNPPSMGCDEWHPEPISGSFEVGYEGGIGKVTLKALAAGAEPFSFRWMKDGVELSDGALYSQTLTSNMLVRVADPAVAGGYQAVVSNSYGMATGQVSQLKLHYVDSESVSPVSPFSYWTNAAATIQDAVDVSHFGQVVVVTNGTYTDGGRPLIGDLTNRVAIDREIVVLSVNGPDVTTIQGAKDPVSTNGPAAVRCVCIDSDDAAIKGFTLSGGATLSYGLPLDQQAGGILGGSGLLGGTAANCKIVDNDASVQGGGAEYAVLVNCEVYGNRAKIGGGVSGGAMYSTTVSGNIATLSVGGLRQGTAYNSIIYHNSAPSAPNYQLLPYHTVTYSCTYPPRAGTGNIAEDPLLLEPAHIAANSPCRGVGYSPYAFAVDIDGEAWLNPPSMGCDEVYEADLVGPLSVSIEVMDTNVVQGVSLPLTGLIEGRASSLEWDFGDGVVATNVSYLTAHSWTNWGEYTVSFTAFNTDNPSGVSTNVGIHVLALESPEVTALGYTNVTFSLEFSSQTGVGYVIEKATNLVPPVVWSTLTTRTGSGGVMQVTDAAATNGMRFYRISVP